MSDPRPRRRRLRARAEALSTVESILGAAIVVGWGLLATLAVAPPLVVVSVVAVGLFLHAAAIETGNHGLLWLATSWVLLLVVVSAASIMDDASPLAFTVASATALAHNETVRAGYARRRNAQVDRQVFVSAATGIGAAALVAIVGIGIAQPLADDPDRTWLWMPVAVVVLALVAAAFTVVPARRSPEPDKRRWRPGDRIPPPPSPTAGE